MNMLKIYMKILIRNLWKNRFFFGLNILGLAVGMTGYLLIFQYVTFELSYDGFHENKSNIYRLQRDVYRNNALRISLAKTSFNLGPAMKEEFPEVLEAARCMKLVNNIVSYNEQKYSGETIVIADASIFKIFTLPLLQGDPASVLKEPNKVVISRSTAQKYFGAENPVGKMIDISNKQANYTCMVDGVFKDIPGNSIFKFDMLISLNTVFNVGYSDWVFTLFHTYILLTPDANPELLAAKFPRFIDKYIIKNVPLASHWKILLQPLRDIYLYSNLVYDTENGNGQTVYFLLLIAVLVLVISWINYINLTIARAVERAKEVVIRKVLGGYRTQLIKRFLTESLLINIIPMVISVILSILFIPYLRELTGKAVLLTPAGDYRFWLNLVAMYIICSLLSGLSPALVLSSFKPVTVLKRMKLSQTTGGILFRKCIVIFQFTASAILIILTFTVYRQIDYMRNRDLGINMEQVLAIKLPAVPEDAEYIKNRTNLKTELLKYPAIKSVTGSGFIPGSDPRLRRIAKRENEDYKAGKALSIIFVDYDFLPTYQLQISAGRNFSKEFGTDTRAAIINEAAVKTFGFAAHESALNQNIFIFGMKNNQKINIIGVLKNYYHQTLKKNQDPIVFLLDPNINNYYSLKLNPSNTSETLAIIKQKWGEIFPGYPFDYFFLEDHFDHQYKTDRQFGEVLLVFVMLAIFITCLGLLSLSYFSTIQRTREIGIRKAMGAAIGDILSLLTKDIIKLVVTAAVISWPIAYYITNSWLQTYANRITIPWWFFIVSGLLVGIISLLTIGYHTTISAKANPVDALREE